MWQRSTRPGFSAVKARKKTATKPKFLEGTEQSGFTLKLQTNHLDHAQSIEQLPIAVAPAPAPSLAIIFGLVCLIAAFYMSTIRIGHVWGDDHCAYIQHARNIVEGTRYENTGYLRSPTTIYPKAYPPGFPLLLAPIYRFYGLNLKPMKVMEICFFSVALLLLYYIVRETATPWLALSTVALTGLSPYFWEFKDSVLSDIPFLAFSYAALLVALRIQSDERSSKRMICFGVMAGGLAYAAYSIRTVGIVLLPSLLLQDMIRKRKLTMFSIAAGLVFVSAAFLQKLAVNVESDYLDTWSRVASLGALLHTAKYYPVCFTTLWENGHSAILQAITYALASAIALYGAWMRVRKHWTVIETFGVLYALLIILFPWGGKRYLIPIMPIYFFYFINGIYELSKGAGRLRMPVQAIAAVLILACFATKYETLDWHQVPNGTQNPTITAMVNYVRNGIGRNGVVVFTRARFLALYAETKTLDIYRSPDSAQVLDFYRNTGVTHVITTRLTDPRGNEFLSQLIERYPNLFAKRFGNEDFSVYQLNRL